MAGTGASNRLQTLKCYPLFLVLNCLIENDNNYFNNNLIRGFYQMTTSSNSGKIDWMHWIIRLVALIIDSIICLIPYAIIYAIIVVADTHFFRYGGFFVGPFIFGIIEVIYFVILEVYWGGATIGKRILGLQVQLVNGGKVTMEKSLIRNITKIYWLFLLLDWLVAILTPGNDRRQKYSDRYAGTTVVQVGRAPIGSTPPSSPLPPPPPT
jgi:uncharacterized RDD family membrane protein YckC